MLFSDVFKVDKKIISNYGAVNISLVNDTPLFIDPLLIYANKDENIKTQYENIVKYLLYLNVKAKEELDEKHINYYFSFKEHKQNWLGVSSKGNDGRALGKIFANELYDSIGFICDNNNISQKIHIEKMYLFKDGVGKDKISDWVTNVILSFFVEYTESFAKQFIDPKYCKKVFVKRCVFNYDTGLFEDKEAYLPFYINHKGTEDYVLLTPKSILRKEEQAINHSDLLDDLDDIRLSLSNDELRFQVDTIVNGTIRKFYETRAINLETISTADINKVKTDGLLSAIDKHPILYDYYVKNKEDSSANIVELAEKETDKLLNTTISNNLVEMDVFNYQENSEFLNAFEEAKYRIGYLKNEIEVNGVWKNLYYKDKPIAEEANLQNLFKLVWCRSKYVFSPESNAGVGPVDFLVTFGSSDKCLIEFKLASNTKLSGMYNQVSKYKISQMASKAIIVVFYFSDSELIKATKVMNNNPDKDNNLVILIDCIKDNKKSASK